MIVKPKYQKRVFSGKAIPVIGMDEGKSPLYRGDGVRFMNNGWYEACLQVRIGQSVDSTYSGGINTAGRMANNRFLCEGNNIWAVAT